MDEEISRRAVAEKALKDFATRRAVLIAISKAIVEMAAGFMIVYSILSFIDTMLNESTKTYPWWMPLVIVPTALLFMLVGRGLIFLMGVKVVERE